MHLQTVTTGTARHKLFQCDLHGHLLVQHVETGSTQSTSITAAAMEHGSNGDLSTLKNVALERTCRKLCGQIMRPQRPRRGINWQTYPALGKSDCDA